MLGEEVTVVGDDFSVPAGSAAAPAPKKQASSEILGFSAVSGASVPDQGERKAAPLKPPPSSTSMPSKELVKNFARTRKSSAGALLDSDEVVEEISTKLTQELNGLGKTAVTDYAFEFICEKKKCGHPCTISGKAMREAALAGMRSKKYKKGNAIMVEVACPKCGKLHNLAAPTGDLDP